jgi:putative FmdB family regulatory protein
MPHYEYECPVCGEFEEFHSIMIKLDHCPMCKEKGNEVEVKRLISGGSGKGIMSLTDDEFKASLPGEVNKLKSEMSKSEKVYSDLLGHDKYQKIQTQIDNAKRERGRR